MAMPSNVQCILFISKGMGTQDSTLIRVVVSRCECDMVQIKQQFNRRYNQQLGKFIQVCFFAIQIKRKSYDDVADK